MATKNTPEAAALAQYDRDLLNTDEKDDLNRKYRTAQERQATTATQAEKTAAKLEYVAAQKAAKAAAAERIQDAGAKSKTPSVFDATGRIKEAIGRSASGRAGGGGGGGMGRLEETNPIARRGMFSKGGRVTGYKGYGKAKKV
jgi:hypothetical protein